jgi:hypothetical protein
LLKEKHSGGIAGHFNHDKTFAQLSSLYYWPGMRVDVKNLYIDVRFVNMKKERDKILVCISHFLFQKGLGMQLVWILYWDYLVPRRELIPYSLCSIDSLRWHISYHARRQMMLHT